MAAAYVIRINREYIFAHANIVFSFPIFVYCTTDGNGWSRVATPSYNKAVAALVLLGVGEALWCVVCGASEI